jgi:hypothetical protein
MLLSGKAFITRPQCLVAQPASVIRMQLISTEYPKNLLQEVLLKNRSESNFRWKTLTEEAFNSENGYYLKPLLAKGVNKVVVALDSDKAGQEGALKLKTFLNKNYPQVEVEVLEFDEGVDPGSLNKEQVNLYFKEWINEDNPNHE